MESLCSGTLRFACVLIARGHPTPEFKQMAAFRLPPHADSGRAWYRAIVDFILHLGDYSVKRLFLAERTAAKPLRVKRQIEFRVCVCVCVCVCVFSVCFHLFPSVSVSLHLFPHEVSCRERGNRALVIVL